ncbi:MAG: ATPase-like protein [Marinobacter sp. T13-3]|nr:MAG: ATPase-like protein [Marinobacter sp. T13-3]
MAGKLTPTDAFLDHELLNSLTRVTTLELEAAPDHSCQLRLVKLEEIHEAHHEIYRKALANAYTSVPPGQSVRLVYLLEGTSNGVGLYLGVAVDQGDTHEAIKNLRGALDGQLPGINFGDEMKPDDRRALENKLNSARFRGAMLGVPTLPEGQGESDKENFQSIDRLVRTMQSSIDPNAPADHWQFTVISQPLTEEVAHQQLDMAYKLSSELALLAQTNVQASSNTNTQNGSSEGDSSTKGTNKSSAHTTGSNTNQSSGTSEGASKSSNTSDSSRSTNTGRSDSKGSGTNESDTHTLGSSTSTTENKGKSWSQSDGKTFGITQEVANKKARHLAEYIDETLIPRLQKGVAKGLFSGVVYLTAENNSTYQRLKNAATATFRGSEISLSPLTVQDLPQSGSCSLLRHPSVGLSVNISAVHAVFKNLLQSASTGRSPTTIGSILTAEELATLAGLPQAELQGIRSKKVTRFAIDLPNGGSERAFNIGHVVDQGRLSPYNPVMLNRHDLNKHTFVTGVTGSGKTTTCLNLLRESGLPFLVIEPAKTEYRELRKYEADVRYYRPNGDPHQSLRINPFALIRKEKSIKSHASFLKNVFTTVFPMEASMPMMIEAAILAAYEDKGWDIDQNEFLPDADPFDPLTRAWPTMGDMITRLDSIIISYGLGKEFEEKYRGSLVSRLRSLTDGTLGQVLDVPQSIDFEALLDNKVVLELEVLQSGEDKALIMALLLGCINDAVRLKHEKNPDFRQITLVEEAHRLLSRPEPGDKAAAMAVESFADMLAEVRKFGVGLVIADQIPSKLIPDVIKNTNTKIVHRLFAEDDRRAMGEAMMMDDEQRAFLPNLDIGEAVIFCGGWHGAAHTKVRCDLAQTDNLQEKGLDIKQLGLTQLWDERKRYYPNFTQLGWLTEDPRDAPEFAEFVRHTRQVQNQLIHFAVNWADADAKEYSKRAITAFDRVKQWLSHWEKIAEKNNLSKEKTTPQFLAKSWAAVLHDGSPLLRTDVQEKTGLLDENAEQLAHSIAEVFNLLNRNETIEEVKVNTHKVHDRDAVSHLMHLKNFKKI